jgi:hypothetical protein
MTIRLRFVWVSLLILPASLGVAQTSSSAPFSIAAVQSAFSLSTPVHQVTLAGNVNWTAGSLEDSGSVTLQGNADGSWTTTMDLQRGPRVESQTAAGSSMTCLFQVKNNEVAQARRPDNCRRSLTWFLPPHQPSAFPEAERSHSPGSRKRSRSGVENATCVHGFGLWSRDLCRSTGGACRIHGGQPPVAGPSH